MIGWILSDLIYKDISDKPIILNCIYYFADQPIENASMLSGFNHHLKSRGDIEWNWMCIDSSKEDPYYLQQIHKKKFMNETINNVDDLMSSTNNIKRKTSYNNVFISKISDIWGILLGLNILDEGICIVNLDSLADNYDILLCISTIAQCQLIYTPWQIYLKITNINMDHYHELYPFLLYYAQLDLKINLYHKAVWDDYDLNLPINVPKQFSKYWILQYGNILQPLANEDSLFYHEF